MVIDTDVYVNIVFVDNPSSTSTTRTFKINGQNVALEGTYESGSLAATDILGKDWTVQTHFFVAKRTTSTYSFPDQKSGFLCAAPLASAYSDYNFVSNLFASKSIIAETFLV